MTGYKQLVSKIHTNAALLNTVLTAATIPSSESQLPYASRRRVLSEHDRRRTATTNRRQDAIVQKFREVSRERRQLIDRHREAIESLDTTDLAAIVDVIEFTQTVDKKLLQSISKIVNENLDYLRKLNDRQISVLISAGSKVADQVSIQVRKEYLDKLWNRIMDNNIPINILSYNAKISANIDNEVEQDVVGLLEELDKVGIDANEQTFGLLSKIYALKGNTNGITEIINILKNQNIAATQQLFESLVYSMAYNGEDQSVRTIIQSVSASPAVNAADLYIAAATAIATKTNNVDKVVDLLVDIPHAVTFKRKENIQGMINVVVILLESGSSNVIDKIKPFMFLDQLTQSLPFGYDSSRVIRKIHQMYRQNNEPAAIELFSILDKDSKNLLRRFFEESLYESIADTGKTLRLANLLRDSKVITNPLIRVIDKMYETRMPIFPIYDEFLNSPEYENFKDRSHLLFPKVSSLIKDIKNAKTNSEMKKAAYMELLPLLNETNLPTEYNKQIASLFASEAEDENNLTELLSNHRKYSKTIVTYIVQELFMQNKLSELEALMNGPLSNEELYLSRMFHPISRFLKYSELKDVELRTISKIIACGFPSNRPNFNERYAFQFIYDIMVNKAITDERLEDLIRILSKNQNVSLSADEIRKIEDRLRQIGYHNRSQIIKQLKRKSQALQRWLNSDINELEKEVAYCEGVEEMKGAIKAKLYEVLLDKYRQTNDPSVCGRMTELIKKFKEVNAEKSYLLPKFTSSALSKAFKHKDEKVINELWQSCNHDDFTKLEYSLFLLENGKEMQATEIISSLKKSPQDMLLLKVIQEFILSSTIIEKFINILSKQFSISSLTRKRLTTMSKTIEIKNLIKKGALEEAFKVAEKMTAIHGVALGQNDLMAACINSDNVEILRKVFSMVVSKHGKLSAITDMIVAFLECNDFSKAENLFKGAVNAGFSLSTAKLEYLIGRETELKRPDVLHNIFVLINDPDYVSTADLISMLGKVISMYEAEKNLSQLEKLKADVAKFNFRLDQTSNKMLNDAIENLLSEKK